MSEYTDRVALNGGPMDGGTYLLLKDHEYLKVKLKPVRDDNGVLGVTTAVYERTADDPMTCELIAYEREAIDEDCPF